MVTGYKRSAADQLFEFALHRLRIEGGKHIVIRSTSECTFGLGDILVSNGFVTPKALNASMNTKAQGVMLGDWLVQQSVITRKQLGQALERQFDVPYAEIDVGNSIS